MISASPSCIVCMYLKKTYICSLTSSNYKSADIALSPVPETTAILAASIRILSRKWFGAASILIFSRKKLSQMRALYFTTHNTQSKQSKKQLVGQNQNLNKTVYISCILALTRFSSFLRFGSRQSQREHQYFPRIPSRGILTHPLSRPGETVALKLNSLSS